MLSIIQRSWSAVLFAALVACLVSSDLLAQPGGGRRGGGRGFGGPGGGFGGPGAFGGGGFGRGGGIAGELRRTSVQEELGLSEEQLEQINEATSAGFDRDRFGEFRDRMRSAQSDEEREAVQAEMRAMFEQQQQQTEARLKEILSNKQFERANQIRLHRAGTRALADENLAKEIGLSDAQRKQLEEINAQRDAARQELGFRMTDEQREEFRKEWDAKYTAVLSSSQKSAWEKKLGPPPPEGEDDFGRGRSDRGDRRADAGPSPSPTPMVQPRPQPQIIIAPPPEGAEVVSSFGAPAGEAEGRDQEEAIYSFNFRYAPWPEVLRLFADRAGFTLDLEMVPPGTFNYYDDGVYTATQALDIINGYLLPKGYVLIRNHRFLACTVYDPTAPGGGIAPHRIPYVPIEELAKRGNNEMMTVIFPLEGLDIDQTANEIEQLLGPQGKVVGLHATNSLVVTSIGRDLRRVHATLQKAAAGIGDTTFRAHAVKNIPANEAENSIRAMLGLEVGARDVSAGGGFDDRGRFDPRMFERMRQMQAGGGNTTPDPLIASDMRTNKLLVTATLAQHKIVEETLAVIDVAEQAGDFPFRAQKPYLVVYEVDRADPREVVKTLGVLIPGVVVNEDGRNGLIHIQATEDQHREVATLIRQLDGMGGGQQIAVIPLSKTDPLTAAATVRAMFISDGDEAPVVEPDLYGRQVMIRGNTDQIEQARQILLGMGEDGTGRRMGGASRIQTFSMMGRDPADLLEYFERMSRSPIRVVYPEDRGPIRDIRNLNQREETREESKKSEGLDSVKNEPKVFERRIPIRRASQTFSETSAEEGPSEPAGSSKGLSDDELDSLLDLLDDKLTPADTEKPAVPSQDASPAQGSDTPPVVSTPPAEIPEPQVSDAPVTIIVRGDELIITSEDPIAVAQAEEMLNELIEMIPVDTSWTIYPLETADVMVVSQMLGELFPDSDVSSGGSSGLLGGFSSFSDSLSDVTGLSGLTSGSLKMIPYPTDNALFVSGPRHRVQEIEEMLQLLDSGELSASLRDRTPRTIPVQYADIDDVYNAVKDVYHDYLETEQDRGARNAGRMMASMMGSGGQQQQQQTRPAARLSLGIDRQTSQLIVFCQQQSVRRNQRSRGVTRYGRTPGASFDPCRLPTKHEHQRRQKHGDLPHAACEREQHE